jgi:protein tyrosine phosphatase (PTP) superfamily phosphohydrolase (DUF442 family)
MSERQAQEILNFSQVSNAIGTGGQPTKEQFSGIKAAGYEVVVNLAMPDSPDALADEAKLVTRQGMVYVHIPVAWEAPTAGDLERFFALMDRNQGKKVFVHCVVNKRVSAFVFLYRVIRQGVPLEMAREALRRIWEPNPVWQNFIDESLARHGASGR